MVKSYEELIAGSMVDDYESLDLEQKTKVRDTMFMSQVFDKPPEDIYDIIQELNKETWGTPLSGLGTPPSRKEDVLRRWSSGYLNMEGAIQQLGILGKKLSPMRLFEDESEARLRDIEINQLEIYGQVLFDVANTPALALTNDDTFAKVTDIIFSNLSPMSFSGLVGIATGGIGAGVSEGLQEAYQAKQTALSNNVDMATANQIGLGVGIINGIIGQLGFKGAEDVFKKAAGSFTTRMMKAGKVIGYSSLIEGIQETLQEFPQIGAEMKYRNVTLEEAVERVYGSFAGGALLGGMTKGGSVTARNLTSAIGQKKLQSHEEYIPVSEQVEKEEFIQQQNEINEKLGIETTIEPLITQEPPTTSVEAQTLSGAVESKGEIKPILSKATLRNDKYYLSFDDTAKIPEAKELEEFFNNNNIRARVSVIKYKKDIGSAVKGTIDFTIDVFDEQGRNSPKLAKQLYDEKLGLPEYYNEKTKTERVFPFEERFRTTVQHAINKLSGAEQTNIPSVSKEGGKVLVQSPSQPSPVVEKQPVVKRPKELTELLPGLKTPISELSDKELDYRARDTNASPHRKWYKMEQDIRKQERTKPIQNSTKSVVEKEESKTAKEVVKEEDITNKESPPAKVEEVLTSEKELPSTFAAKDADVEEMLHLLGFDEIASPKRKKDRALVKESIEKKYPDNALSIAQELLSTKRTPSDVEVIGLAIAVMRRNNAVVEILNKSSKTQDKAELIILSEQEENLEKEMQILLEAIDITGTEQARAFRARQILFNRNYDVVHVKRKVRLRKGKELTAVENKTIEELTTKFNALQKEYDKLKAIREEEKAVKTNKERTLKKNKIKTKEQLDVEMQEKTKKLNELLEAGCL